jgi:hypothetical protein
MDVLQWVRGASEGCIVAGGNEVGQEFNQIYNTRGIFFEINMLTVIWIADTNNHRIMMWLYHMQLVELL